MAMETSMQVVEVEVCSLSMSMSLCCVLRALASWETSPNSVRSGNIQSNGKTNQPRRAEKRRRCVLPKHCFHVFSLQGTPARTLPGHRSAGGPPGSCQNPLGSWTSHLSASSQDLATPRRHVNAFRGKRWTNHVVNEIDFISIWDRFWEQK